MNEAALVFEDETGGHVRGELNVLVVEDDEADAHLITSALAGVSAVGAIAYARDGVAALDLVDSGAFTPDVALIDLNMPRMNGMRLLVEFGCRPDVHFPVIVLTSSSASRDATRSRCRGAADVIVKPESPTDLETALRRALSPH